MADIGAKISIDGEKQFRQDLQNITQQGKTLAAEMDKVSTAFRNADDSEKDMGKVTETLNKQIENQRKLVDKLKEAVVNPLTGRKVGAYYGCLLLRPSNVMAFDDPENPTILEDFIRALGAEPVMYPYRNECCGGYISIKEQDKAAALCKKITDSAEGFQADCLVTACPLCKYNLSKNSNLPIVYFTELLAEALGIKEAQE